MKTNLYFVLAILLLIYCSCDNLQEKDVLSSLEKKQLENVDKIVAPAESSESIVRDADIDKIVEAVATSDEMGKTRQEAKNYSKSTYVGKDGTPAVHVINYPNERGFILISATKNYVPVLAFSPNGNFDAFDKHVNGLDIWKAETLEALSIAKGSSDEAAEPYRRMWKSYLTDGIEISKIKRKAMNYFDVSQAWHQQLQAWMQAGYTVHAIDDNITGNTAIDAQFRYAAQQGIYPLYEDDWEQYSAVVEREVADVYTINNFIQSTWSQDGSYNDSCFTSTGQQALAGCGPIAIGQIARQYEYPTYFTWTNMPYNYATSTTAQFLHIVGVMANISYGTSGSSVTFSGITNALNTLGYLFNTGTHNIATVKSSLVQHYPVLMTGHLQSSDEGHAWIACGSSSNHYFTRYEVFTFTGSTTIGSVDTYDTGDVMSYMVYMNWGWLYGAFNGYYVDNNSHVIGNDYDVYISNRVNIYNIRPINY